MCASAATDAHLLSAAADLFIYDGDQPRRAKRPLRLAAGRHWSFVALQSGTATLHSTSGAERLLAPALLCLQPRSSSVLVLPEGLQFCVVHCGVHWRRRRQRKPGWDAWVDRAGEAAQPSAEEWFGIPLPEVVEAPFDRAGLKAVIAAAQEWWLGELRRRRAGFRLASWLYDWVLARQDAGTEDDWGRLARLARERMGKGVTVTELATSYGCSRSQLFRRMRQELGCTPRAWLDRLRQEEAARLLAADCPPTRVAKVCGFGNDKAFRRWCRRHGLIDR